MKEVNLMKKNEILSLLYQLASPVALIVLGVILLLNPDSASVLIAKLLGWGIFLTGIGFGISGIVGRNGTAGKILAAIFCLGIGGGLLKSPLLLAANIGRFIGILLLLRGGRDFFRSSRREGKALSAVLAVLGIVLIVLPMTTSRVVFSLCGLVVLIVGIVMLIGRLRGRRCLDKGDNIIDAL